MFPGPHIFPALRPALDARQFDEETEDVHDADDAVHGTLLGGGGGGARESLMVGIRCTGASGGVLGGTGRMKLEVVGWVGALLGGGWGGEVVPREKKSKEVVYCPML